MAKLSKRQAAAHARAGELIERGNLLWDDAMFVLENWQESANHINSVAGAFFTPPTLARDFAVEVCGSRIIDLCAGIGTLSIVYAWERPDIEIVCVEKNAAYAEIGKKLLPQATWIVGNALELPHDLGRFDCAIGNPPFGSIKRDAAARRYSGRNFEYHLIEAASCVADYGVFIIPQESAPFVYSGVPCFQEKASDEYRKFNSATGITLAPNCGIDTSYCAKDWHGVSPKVEIVCCDFSIKPRADESVQPDLFEKAA